MPQHSSSILQQYPVQLRIESGARPVSWSDEVVLFESEAYLLADGTCFRIDPVDAKLLLSEQSPRLLLGIQFPELVLSTIGGRFPPTSTREGEARALYEEGEAALKAGLFEKAAQSFVKAGQLGHPQSKTALENLYRVMTDPLRVSHPEVFNQIRAGDRFRTLQTLRALAPSEPLALPLLAYALLGSGCSEEGLSVCEAAFRNFPLQSDVLSLNWSFLWELARYEECREAAEQYRKLFPLDPLGYKNLLYSSLIAGDSEMAWSSLQCYRVLTASPALAAREFFQVCEQLNRWAEAAEYLERVLAVGEGTPQVLGYYAECLIELGELDEAVKLFEKLFVVGDAEILCGYARALARAGAEDKAEEFLATVVSDGSRFDSPKERAFLVTLLAEIRRRTGRPTEAASLLESEVSDFGALARVAGPLPGIEYCESLLLLDRFSEARDLLRTLFLLFPDDPFVREMCEITGGHEAWA